MQLPGWATQKLGPLPVWGWGALALGGGVGFVLYKRRQSSSTAAPTLATGAQAIPSTYPQASDPGGAPGGFGSGLPGGYPGGYPTGGYIGPYPYQQPPPQQLPPAQQPVSTTPQGTYSYAPAVAISPSLLGGGYIASQSQLSNPVGSALADSLASYNAKTGTYSYMPSLTDYATEQTGGIQTVQAGLPGTEPSQGLTYSIYGTNTGSGAPVPADQRIAGERYDAYGRVIY